MNGCPKRTLSFAGAGGDDDGVLSEEIDEQLRMIAAEHASLRARESELVVRARSTGASWTELGHVLGLSKQAVRRRHLAVDPVFARRSERPPTIAEYHDEMMTALRAARGESVE